MLKLQLSIVSNQKFALIITIDCLQSPDHFGFMSGNSTRSVYYYQLLVKKHKASGLGVNQARVYQELSDLIAACTELKEMQLKMKSAGYFEKPAQALYIDKMLAHAKAARELGFVKVAEIYEDRSAEVEADYNKAWVTGFEKKVNEELNRISEVVDTWRSIFQSYECYLGAPLAYRAEEQTRISIAVNKIQKLGEKLESLSDNLFYRKFIVLDDARYAEAIQKIHALQSANLDIAAAQNELKTRTEAMLKSPGIDRQKLSDLGKDFDSRCKRSVYLCVAPREAPGPYSMEKFFEE